MLIDYTFFQGGSLDIEGITLNVISPDSTNTAIVGGLRSFIAEFEPEYLEKLLGRELYLSFSDYLDKRNAMGADEREMRWEFLIDELVHTRTIGEDTIHISPIANYVYFFYLRHNHAQATTTGVKQDTDDGKLVSPERKMVSAWNGMAKMNVRLFDLIGRHYADYPCWEPDLELIECINIMSL